MRAERELGRWERTAEWTEEGGTYVVLLRKAAVEAAQEELGPPLAELLDELLEKLEEVEKERNRMEEQYVGVVKRVEMRLMKVEAGVGSLMKQYEKRGELQTARVVGAVEEMTDEVKRMRVGQSEMARLVKGMGGEVGDVGCGLSGLASTVRTVQRLLDARTGDQKRLTKLVSRLEVGAAEEAAVRAEMVGEGGQQISPPDTGRKEVGRGGPGRASGRGGSRRQILFKEEEQEGAVQEEAEQVYGEGGEAQGVYEEMRAEVALGADEQMSRVQKQLGDAVASGVVVAAQVEAL